jgi:hypothetical protein
LSPLVATTPCCGTSGEGACCYTLLQLAVCPHVFGASLSAAGGPSQHARAPCIQLVPCSSLARPCSCGHVILFLCPFSPTCPPLSAPPNPRRSVKVAEPEVVSYGGLTTVTKYHLARKDEHVVDSGGCWGRQDPKTKGLPAQRAYAGC